MTIGFVGLGNMGRPMASNLMRKGFSGRVHDIDRDRMRTLEALGAESAVDRRGVAAGERKRRDLSSRPLECLQVCRRSFPVERQN
jgi:prephenate dehydrogenase